MEGQAINGIKTMSGSVYHLLNETYKTDMLRTKCNYTFTATRVMAQRFESIEDPNICKHCAMKAWQECA